MRTVWYQIPLLSFLSHQKHPCSLENIKAKADTFSFTEYKDLKATHCLCISTNEFKIVSLERHLESTRETVSVTVWARQASGDICGIFLIILSRGERPSPLYVATFTYSGPWTVRSEKIAEYKSCMHLVIFLGC